MLHFAIGKPMAHHSKFAVKRRAKATLANYGKVSRAKHRGKKRPPASHKRMANNGIFTFSSESQPRFTAVFSLLINKEKWQICQFLPKNWKNAVNRGLTVLYPFRRKRQKCCLFAKTFYRFPVAIFRWPVFLGPQGPWP